MSAEATIFVLPVYYLSKGFKACLEANVEAEATIFVLPVYYLSKGFKAWSHHFCAACLLS